MVYSNTPARAPEPRPETNAEPKLTWPRSTKKPARFVIKIAGNIPG